MGEGNVVRLDEVRARRGAQPPMLRKADIAQYFGVTERTITRWMDRGLPFHKRFEGGAVRFRLVECVAWFERTPR